MIVQSGAVNLHVGVAVIDVLYALGSGYQNHELDALAAQLLHFGDGHVSAAAGGQHGVNDEHIPVCNILGVLQKVEVRHQSLLVPVHADVAHTGGGHQCQNTVLKAKARPQNGHDGHLFAGQHGSFIRAQGGLNGLSGHGQIPGGLIGQQHGDLTHQGAEILYAGVLVAHH